MSTILDLGEVGNIEDYVSLIESHFSGASLLWFRGQRDFCWHLKPSIHRPDLKLSTEDLVLAAEQTSLALFRQRSIPYIETLFTDRGNISDWNYLFLMQHFGIPTRLLDWTENALTALYFAVSNAYEYNKLKEDAAVWVLDPENWNRAIFRGAASVETVLNPSDSALSNWAPDSPKKASAPVAIYGDYNSRRIALQQGTFTVFGSGLKSMNEIHSEYSMESSLLGKVRIPHGNLEDLYMSLRRFGFREASIYPDMIGLSKDISIAMRIKEKNHV